MAVATQMNRAIERAVMMAPEQYMWLHRRFKTRPEGQPDRYARKTGPVLSQNFLCQRYVGSVEYPAVTQGRMPLRSALYKICAAG